MASSGERICAIILAFFFPPLGVLLLRGCGKDLLINVLLTILLLWFGGMVHAVWIAVADAGQEDERRKQQLPVAQPPPSNYQPPAVSGAAVPQPPYPAGQQPAGWGGQQPGVVEGYPAGGVQQGVGPHGYPVINNPGAPAPSNMPTMPAKQ